MDETSVTAPGGGSDRDLVDDTRPDGRAVRGRRTRTAVVDALLSLNNDGNLRPTTKQVAERAGVSLRSVYVHFDDTESLLIAAAARHSQQLSELVPPVRYVGDLDARLTLFVTRRSTLNERSAQVRRAAVLQEPFSPALHEALTRGRERMRADVAAAFGPELDATPPAARSRLLAALDIVAAGNAWESLRTHQHLSIAEAEEQLRDTVLALLHGWQSAEVLR